MAVLITLLEQHLDRQLSTVVTQATTWWETVLALVKPQEIGLGVHLPVKVFGHIHKKHANMYLALAYLHSRGETIWKGMTVQAGLWVEFWPSRKADQTSTTTLECTAPLLCHAKPFLKHSCIPYCTKFS